MEDQFLLAEIAKLYYYDKVKQNEIAERFNLTPMLISRMLKKAEEANIVSFHIKMPARMNLELGKTIRSKYDLLECIVLQDAGSQADEKIGEYLSRYIVRLLHKESVIGLSWGKKISSFAKSLPFLNYQDCKVLQLSGGFLAQSDYMVTPTSIVKTVSEKFNCIPYFLNAPFFMETEEAKIQVLNDPSNHYVMDMAKKTDINIIGLSKLSAESTVSKVDVLNERDITELKERGAIGDIAGIFIDKNGDEVEWSKSKLYVGASIADIQKAKHVICVAGEEDKAEVMIAAMKKGYFNVLITSEEVAYKLA